MIEIHHTIRGVPVGECIYCGRTDRLQDEHPVPLGLGGKFILPKASCQSCADITSAFEMRVLRGFMRNGRTAGRFPTRRRKQRLTSIPLQIEREGRTETIKLRADESPGFLDLPMLARPAFLNGSSPVLGVNLIGSETLGFGKALKEVARALGADAIQSTSDIDATAFVRMLAKIGYGFAVANMGPYPHREVPVLPLILGTADDGGTWVGSADFRLGIEAKRPLHALGLIQVHANVDGHPEKILVARVKLFAGAGTTGYEVVVRRQRG